MQIQFLPKMVYNSKIIFSSKQQQPIKIGKTTMEILCEIITDKSSYMRQIISAGMIGSIFSLAITFFTQTLQFNRPLIYDNIVLYNINYKSRKQLNITRTYFQLIKTNCFLGAFLGVSYYIWMFMLCFPQPLQTIPKPLKFSFANGIFGAFLVSLAMRPSAAIFGFYGGLLFGWSQFYFMYNNNARFKIFNNGHFIQVFPLSQQQLKKVNRDQILIKLGHELQGAVYQISQYRHL